MIKCDNGELWLEGTRGRLLAEYAAITKGLRESLLKSGYDNVWINNNMTNMFMTGMTYNSQEVDND